MTKRTITILWLLGIGVMIVGGLLALFTSLALASHIGAFAANSQYTTYVPGRCCSEQCRLSRPRRSRRLAKRDWSLEISSREWLGTGCVTTLLDVGLRMQEENLYEVLTQA